jgi:hypothetical protein
MKKITFIMLIGIISITSFSQNTQKAVVLPQNYQIDTRIDNIGYWQKMAKLGLVPVQPMYKPQPAKFTGTKVFTNNGTLVSDSPDIPVTTNVNTESENSIFGDPGDKNHVLNSNNSTPQPSTGSLYGADWYNSFDAGDTWTGSYHGAGEDNNGDPAVCINMSGRYFIGYIDVEFGQTVAYSDNNGSTWTNVKVASAPSGFVLDKNHLWVDNSPTSQYKGYLYNGWMDPSQQIAISRSITNGTNWEASKEISNAIVSGGQKQGVNFKTGPNGEVYAVFAVYESWPNDEGAIGFSKSLDGGVTWSPATRIISNIKGIRNSGVPENMRVNSFPSMACDISNGPHRGNLYVCWTNHGVPGVNTGNDIDCYMIMSSDGGTTWSSPIKINQNPSGLGKTSYLPWITCDQANGCVSVVFYSNRNVSNNQDAATFMAYSTDGGNNFTDMQVSDFSFTPAPIPNMAKKYMGDYLGITAYDGNIYPTWTDNHIGYCMTYVSPILSCICQTPENLNTTNITSSTATLSWDDVQGSDGYYIQYRIIGANLWITEFSSNSSFEINNLSSCTPYEWRVQTICPTCLNQSSDWSTITQFLTVSSGGSGCGIPLSPQTSNITATSATLSWNAANGAIIYRIQYRITGTSSWMTKNSISNTTTLNYLTPCTNYEWQVESLCNLGTSCWSTLVRFTTIPTGGTGCQTPNTPFTSNITANSARLNWTPVTGYTQYNVQYRVLGTTVWTIIPTNTYYCNLTGLTPCTQYEWQVQTNCGGGTSCWTSMVNFRTISSTSACSAPAYAYTTGVTSNSATLYWDYGYNAIYYRIRYRIIGTPDWTSTSTSANSYYLTNLSSCTQYEWQVQSVCSNGSSCWTLSTIFTTQPSGSCPSPSPIGTTNIGTTSATLNWTLCTGYPGYNVRYRIASTYPWTNSYSQNTYLQLINLLTCTTYEWQVNTDCGSGTSSCWSISSFFTTMGNCAGSDKAQFDCSNPIKPGITQQQASLIETGIEYHSIIPSQDEEYWFIFKVLNFPSGFDVEMNGLSDDYEVAVIDPNGNQIAVVNTLDLSGQKITLPTVQERYYFIKISTNQEKSIDNSTCYGLKIFSSINNDQNGLVNQNKKFHSYHIYPNPAKKLVNLEYITETTGQLIVKISDMLGILTDQKIFKTEKGKNSYQIDISTFPRGQYLIQLIKGSYFDLEKLIVE